jgi:hypothetical protein
MSREELSKLREEFAEAAAKEFEKGFDTGTKKTFVDIASSPDLAAKIVSTMDPASHPGLAEKILGNMDPAARENVIGKFRKGWLTRVFGG